MRIMVMSDYDNDNLPWLANAQEVVMMMMVIMMMMMMMMIMVMRRIYLGWPMHRRGGTDQMSVKLRHLVDGC